MPPQHPPSLLLMFYITIGHISPRRKEMRKMAAGGCDSHDIVSEKKTSLSKKSSGFSIFPSGKRSSKGKRLWKKVKYQLVEFQSLPAFLRDNEFILGQYRSEWPLKQLFLSIFTIHNETLNIWTHLLGFLLFLWLTICTAVKVPKVVELPEALAHSELIACLTDAHFLELLSDYLPHLSANSTSLCLLHGLKHDLTSMVSPLLVTRTTRWPFLAFLWGAMFCLLSSSTCHLLLCHSERLAYIMLRLDYAGIAALITTSFYPPVYYSFMCHPFLRNLYMGFITTLGFASVIVSLVPVFQTAEYRKVRACLFSGMGMSGIVPILHKVILHWDQAEAMHTAGYEVLMGAFYGIGALVYATRVPERWMPGKFDIAGHSHQLFHLLVVAGAYSHYRAGIVYLKWRDVYGC